MGLVRRLKQSFVAGLILVAPLVVTAYVLVLLVGWSAQLLDPLVREMQLLRYTDNVELAAQALAAGMLLTVITLLGALAQRQVGNRTFRSVGRVVNFVPLVNTVYGSVRQVATAMVEQNTRYERVVLVEYPRKGVYVIGLVTGDGPTAAETVADEDVYSVYLPNSPNPTGGRLLLVPESQVHETDMSVRRGLRMILTTGVATEGRSDRATESPPERPPKVEA
ncbi:DUF502 domain-containing protein [Halorussus amylolyticus]|uniref:DUF502 domain-containing protein n=1 Tax=Halorussus amylolyticus TaxID=1126242 RepID=UPI00138F2680|nr:DUF502 domain-containing protein [Halorussus amylolyticus]